MRNYNAYGLEGPSLLDADGDGIITKEELDSASLLAILSETDLYKEMSRQTRRDEYDYQDWINVRSSNRLLSNLRTLPASRVVRSLWRELAFLVSLSSVLVWFNSVGSPWLYAEGYTSSVQIVHATMEPWDLTASFLSLLVAFRTNASYERWMSARTIWQHVTTICRNAALQICWKTELSSLEKANGIGLLSAYTLCLHAHVADSGVSQLLPAKLEKLLSKGDATKILMCENRPLAALGLFTKTCNRVADGDTRLLLQTGVTELADDMGKCERIFKTPIPRIYSRHTARFLGAWLVTLPFGLYDTCSVDGAHWLLVPCMVTIGCFLLGIEELASQIEEPFSILPIAGYCNEIERSMREVEQMAVDDA
jgi:predicted membrane chloride channel (bestrophin family)